MTLRTVIYSMLGLTIAWSLNAMGLDLPINMWSLTALNFLFSLIVTLILRSLLDWELSSILASISIRVLIEQQWRLVVEYKIKSRLIWIVSLLVQQKLAGRSLNSTCMKSHQQSNISLSIFPMNTMSTSMHTRLLMYHKRSLTICDGCFDTLKSSKMQSVGRITSSEEKVVLEFCG